MGALADSISGSGNKSAERGLGLGFVYLIQAACGSLRHVPELSPKKEFGQRTVGHFGIYRDIQAYWLGAISHPGMVRLWDFASRLGAPTNGPKQCPKRKREVCFDRLRIVGNEEMQWQTVRHQSW